MSGMKAFGILMSLAAAGFASAAEPVIPAVEGLAFLKSWRAGVKAADAGEDPLVVVCFGDSNTEMGTYTAALRELLQGCYGERGYGYHTFGARVPAADAPKLEKQGGWTDRRVGPETPPTPWFAPDLLWTETDDPAASASVSFSLGAWGGSGDSLARTYDGRQQFRIHYQKGPGLGSFGVYAGTGELARTDTAADKPGYGVSEAFLADGFRVAGVKGKVVLLGYDGVRKAYQRGMPRVRGGAMVHALGRSWGQAAHFARIDPDTFRMFFWAVQPDLITVLLGTNDMHNEGQPDRYRDNVTTLLVKIREAAPGVGILVIACPEASQTRDGFAARYRDIARDVAKEQACAFWSLADLVGERSRDWTREGFFADGLHYSRLGGGLWARLLLRQLGFDLNDLAHYPVLRPEPVQAGVLETAILRVADADALAKQPPFVIWGPDRPAAELRLGLAGPSLAVHARVFGANPDASIELYVSKNETNAAVRQLVIRRGAVSLHENGGDRAAPDLKPRIDPLSPIGFEVRAMVPLEALGLDPGVKAFRLEAAAVTAPVAGAAPDFNRLFALRPDRGAFRDSSQSARVTVKD